MTKSSHSTTFAKDEEDYAVRALAGESVILAAALNLPIAVKPTVTDLRALARAIESVNAMSPFASLRRLRKYRSQYLQLFPAADELLNRCVALLARPVEGSTAMDFSYIQGMHVAGGLAAITGLQSAMSAVSEALDRKIAYAVASASMYVAVVSLITTLVLGLLSLPR